MSYYPDSWWNRYNERVQLRTLTEPVQEPVTPDEGKDHLYLTEDSQAGQVDMVMKAARASVEDYTGRSIIKRQVRQTLDRFPRGQVIELVGSPLFPDELLSTAETQLVIQYAPAKLSTDGSTWVTWSSTNYVLSPDSDPPRLTLVRNGEFPNIELRNANAVRLDYWTGYSTGPRTAPDWARMAILLTGAHYFENRESVVVGTVANQVPQSAMALAYSHRSPLAQV